jgi:hypothetical protein
MSRIATPVPSKLFDVFIIRSWWVLLLFFTFFFLFDRGMQSKVEEKELLLEKIERLRKEKSELIVKKEDQKVRLNSEEDWRFLTLLLKERLGVKEEGEEVLFLESTDL